MIFENYDKIVAFSDLIFNLKKLFKFFGYDIRVYGKIDPYIVLNNKQCLSCYLINNSLNIMNDYKEGDELKNRKDRTLFSIPIPKNLNKLNLEYFELDKWIENTVHREMFYIKKIGEEFNDTNSFSTSNLDTYFKGFFKDKPEFTPNVNECKLFFRKDECLKIINELETNFNFQNMIVI